MNLIEVYGSNVLIILYLQLFVFLFLVLKNFSYIKNKFAPTNKKVIIILFLIILYALFIHLKVTDRYEGSSKIRHLTMAQEFSFGSTIFYSSREGEIYPCPYGWGPTYPFLLSILFQLMNSNPISLLIFDLLMIVMATIIMFFLFYFISKDQWLSVIAAFMLNLIFLLGYDIVIQNREPYFFFILLSLFFSLVSFKANKTSMYALALLTILMTMEIRFEAISLLFMFFIGIILYKYKKFRDIKGFWLKIFIAISLFILFFPVYYAELSVGEKSEFASYMEMPINFLNRLTELIFSNYTKNFIESFVWFWTENIDVSITLVVLLGFLFGLKESRYRKETILFSSLFFLYVFAFYVYGNGLQPLYAFKCIIPYTLLFCLGVAAFKNYTKKLSLVATVIIVFYLAYLYGVSFPEWLHGPVFNTPFLVSLDKFNFNTPELNEIRTKIVKPGNLGKLVIDGDDDLHYRIEFILVEHLKHFKDVIPFSNLVHYRRYLANLSKEEEEIVLGDWKYSPELNRRKKELERKVYQRILQSIDINSEMKEEVKMIVFEKEKNNYYIINVCDEGNYETKIDFEYFKKFFNLELISKVGCIDIYKVYDKNALK